MLSNVPTDRAILQKWLAAGYLEKQTLYPTEEGTPQGGIISPVLANLALWANYHRHVVSKRTFSKVDNAIDLALWQWAKRSHSNKPKGWISRKYFGPRDGRSWIFHGEITTERGGTRPVHLLKAAETPIRRHTKIKGDANPFDPQWEVYFEERLGVKMAATLRGRRMLGFLWRQQDGRCPVCDRPITTLTGWHNHHVIWRSLGGSDSPWNRVLLHPHCHRKKHSLGITVEQPRPPQKGVREA